MPKNIVWNKCRGNSINSLRSTENWNCTKPVYSANGNMIFLSSPPKLYEILIFGNGSIFGCDQMNNLRSEKENFVCLKSPIATEPICCNKSICASLYESLNESKSGI